MILVFITQCGKHLEHLRYVFLKLREINLKLNPRKCEFVKINISSLSHIVSKENTQPGLRKIKVVTECLVPVAVTNVKAFLGLTIYYWNYIKGYSCIAIPLFELIKRDIMFLWTPQCQIAFNVLKDSLVKSPIFVIPNFIKTSILDVDWSTKGVGAVLSQKEGRFKQVMAYVSKTLLLV